MAKYTIKLSEILLSLWIKKKYGNEPVNVLQYEDDPYKIIKETRDKIFNFDYDLFDPEHKEELETKILAHYYNYEICCETTGKFIFLLRNTFNEILPYYNQLYRVTKENYDPFINYEWEEDEKKDGTNNNQGTQTGSATNNSSSDYENTGNSESSRTNKNKFSDTPQGELQDIDDNKYVSQYTVDNTENEDSSTQEGNEHSQTTQTQTNTTSGNGEYEDNRKLKITGLRGQDKSKLLLEYKKAIQNVDMEIIKDCRKLFMLIF